jgi:hypothetical protein
VLIAVAVMGVAGLIVTAPLRTASVLTFFALTGGAIMLHRLAEPGTQIVLAAALSVLPLITACIFRNMSFADLPDVTTKVGRTLAAAMSTLYSRFAQER